MGVSCAVCGSDKGVLHDCPTCEKPCHTKCSGRKKGRCDNCRGVNQSLPRASSASSSSSSSSASSSLVSSAREATKPRTRHTRASLLCAAANSPRQQKAGTQTCLPPRRSSSSSPALSSNKQVTAATNTAMNAHTAKPADTTPAAGYNGQQTNSPPVQPVAVTAGAQVTEGETITAHVEFKDYGIARDGNVMIPVSTLDLFFQHFDRLQERLDEIEVFMRRSLDTSEENPPELPPVNSDGSKNSGSRASALEDLMNKHNSQLGELRMDRQLLLGENALLKKHLAQLSSDIAAVRTSVESAPRGHAPLTPDSGTSGLFHRPPLSPT